MNKKFTWLLMLLCAFWAGLSLVVATNFRAEVPAYSAPSFNFYNAEENNSGNPFENFTPEDFFNPSSPLGFIGYLTIFFCMSIPIALLIISIASVAIFVRLGKIRKELSQLNQSRQQPPPQNIPPQVVYQQPAPQPMVPPSQTTQHQGQQMQGQQPQGQQTKQF
ncbi:MAG: hypothetical protein QXD15_00170 [Thermoplasmata archaeon]